MNQLILPGQVIIAGSVKNTKGSAEIKNAQKAGEVLLLTKGLVVAVCGGATIKSDHLVYQEVQQLAKAIVKAGGVLINGGENAGLMLAVAEIAEDKLLGVACEYHPFNPFSQKAIIDHYQTRKMLITSTPVVVAFEGQVGTLDEIITTVGWIKSCLKRGQKNPPRLFVSDYWRKIFEVFKEYKVIQDNVWPYIKIFKNIDEVLKEIII